MSECPRRIHFYSSQYIAIQRVWTAMRGPKMATIAEIKRCRLLAASLMAIGGVAVKIVRFILLRVAVSGEIGRI
jgi:hypothetical protein